GGWDGAASRCNSSRSARSSPRIAASSSRTRSRSARIAASAGSSAPGVCVRAGGDVCAHAMGSALAMSATPTTALAISRNLFGTSTLYARSASPPAEIAESRATFAGSRMRVVKLDVGMLTHDLTSIPAYARKVEALGYDCLWSAETQHDPFLPLAVAATVTSRLKLGTAIAVAFPRSPMITAMIAWDIQKASGGRFMLGLGSQVKAHNERRFSVKFESPGPKMAEAVRAIRAIWDCWQNGTKLNFKGQFYTFDIMTPFFNPGPIDHPDVPIYIAAVNAYMCGVAGEFCDGM